MNRVIYKYEVPVVFNLPGSTGDSLSVSTLRLPFDAEVLTVCAQGQHLVCWAMVDPDQKDHAEHRFVLMATGAELTDVAAEWLHKSFVYHNTVQFNGGSFILHVYQEKFYA